MIANLYLHPQSFVYNQVDNKDFVISKLRNLVDDMTTIVYDYSDENIFKIPSALWNVEVFEGMTICDLAEEGLENDAKGVFYSMMADTSSDYDVFSYEELKEKCKYGPDEDEINTILVFNVSEETQQSAVKNNYITFDSYEIVYNKMSWLYLRRQILGNHPCDSDFFVSECRKYFPNICFHDNCISTLIDDDFNYLEIIPRKIVYYLSCLNDGFNEIKEKHKSVAPDVNSILEDFSGMYGLEKPGSREGDPGKKELLSFSFSLTDESGTKLMLCEPHLKISVPDSNYKGDNNYKHFNPRIYFNFGDTEVEHGRILVGSMGKHVE